MTIESLLVSHFSHVRLCATPQTAAHQAPPSLGFSRQEHWSGLPFPSPMHESEREVTPSCLTLHNPMDCSPPGSAIHRIFQARVLQWGAIAFSEQAASAYQCPQTHEHPREWDYVHAARTVGFWDSRAHISTQSKK